MEMVSKLQKKARLQIRQEFLLETISGMEEAMEDCVCDLVPNLNKAGIGVSEWETANRRKWWSRLR
jgi:hypothetical protein